MKSFVYGEERINKMPKEAVFTYLDFISKVTRSGAIVNHFNKMAVFDLIEP